MAMTAISRLVISTEDALQISPDFWSECQCVTREGKQCATRWMTALYAQRRRLAFLPLVVLLAAIMATGRWSIHDAMMVLVTADNASWMRLTRAAILLT